MRVSSTSTAMLQIGNAAHHFAPNDSLMKV